MVLDSFDKVLQSVSMPRALRVEYPAAMYHVMSRGERPRWLRADRVLGEHGIPQDTAAGRQEFERHLERRRLEEVDQKALQEFRQAWFIGSEAFRRECLEKIR
jgi:hypothetical protein